MADAKERFCWFCGKSMGVIERQYYQSTDTCGASDCERAAREQERAEREEAHRRLDDDLGYSR